jgi:hypothetical protein
VKLVVDYLKTIVAWADGKEGRKEEEKKGKGKKRGGGGEKRKRGQVN